MAQFSGNLATAPFAGPNRNTSAARFRRSARPLSPFAQSSAGPFGSPFGGFGNVAPLFNPTFRQDPLQGLGGLSGLAFQSLGGRPQGPLQGGLADRLGAAFGGIQAQGPLQGGLADRLGALFRPRGAGAPSSPGQAVAPPQISEQQQRNRDIQARFMARRNAPVAPPLPVAPTAAGRRADVLARRQLGGPSLTSPARLGVGSGLGGGLGTGRFGRPSILPRR